jgi:hypothetical protein
MTEKKAFLSKKTVLIALPIIVAILIYLSFVFPWPKSPDVSGTMGGDDGVQRAKKYRSGQMTEADVVLKNPGFQKVVQTDEFQKLLKNDEFLKYASSGNMTNAAENGIIILFGNKDFLQCMNQPSFQNLYKNETFNAVMNISSFEKILFDKNINSYVVNGQFGKVQSNSVFASMINSQEFVQKGIELNEILMMFKSEDYKNVVTSSSFVALAANQSFASFLKSGDLNAGFTQTILNLGQSPEFVNMCKFENFSRLLMSSEFTDMAKSGELQKLDMQNGLVN